MPTQRQNSNSNLQSIPWKNLPDRRESTKPIKKNTLDFLELLIEPDRDWDMGIYKSIKITKNNKKMIGKNDLLWKVNRQIDSKLTELWNLKKLVTKI